MKNRVCQIGAVIVVFLSTILSTPNVFAITPPGRIPYHIGGSWRNMERVGTGRPMNPLTHRVLDEQRQLREQRQLIQQVLHLYELQQRQDELRSYRSEPRGTYWSPVTR